MSGGLAKVDIFANVQIPVHAADLQENTPGCATNAG
jgi:hypothetical protein